MKKFAKMKKKIAKMKKNIANKNDYFRKTFDNFTRLVCKI